MIEVLWHGRGGQGAFTAARLLGAAVSLREGHYALAFPSFGPERRGAPVRAFTKIDSCKIGDRSAIKQADYVVYLDETLFSDGWDAELKEDGHVLVNSKHGFDDPRIISIDATRISREILGREIPNTVFVGAVAGLLEDVEIEDVEEAVRMSMPTHLQESNIRIVRAGASELTRNEKRIPKPSAEAEDPDDADTHARLATALRRHDVSERRADSIPRIQHNTLDPAVFARSTCFGAGHLATDNVGWRNVRPVVDEDACVGCLQCYLYCPDGAIFKVDRRNGNARHPGVAIDYGFCKGCGICARICKVRAIAMVDEPLALQLESEASKVEVRS